jgi:hypothetical protein
MLNWIFLLYALSDFELSHMTLYKGTFVTNNNL